MSNYDKGIMLMAGLDSNSRVEQVLLRLQAFKHFRDLHPEESYTSPEAEDALLLADEIERLRARLAEAEQRILKAANDIDDIATDADLCDVVSQLRQTGRHRPSQHGGAGTRNESMRSACPSCPDGYVWTSEGPTGKACPTCKGKAYLGDDDEDDSASAADSVGEHQPDDE